MLACIIAIFECALCSTKVDAKSIWSKYMTKEEEPPSDSLAASMSSSGFLKHSFKSARPYQSLVVYDVLYARLQSRKSFQSLSHKYQKGTA